MIATHSTSLDAFAPDDLCPACLATSSKLCARHLRDVTPQLARNIGWLKLIGDARIEQRTRQAAPDPALEKAKRRSARKIARSQRRGFFGLARAIMERKAS